MDAAQKTNPLDWLNRLHEAGTITKLADKFADLQYEIDLHQSTIRDLRREARRLCVRAESEAKSLGWTAEQIEAAKRGETLVVSSGDEPEDRDRDGR